MQEHSIQSSGISCCMVPMLFWLKTIGLRILQLYAPYVPHVTEAIFEQIYQQKEAIPSIHQTKFSEVQTSYYFGESVAQMKAIIDLVNHVRKLKTEHQLSLKTDIASLTIYCTDQKVLDALKKQEQLIKGITRAQAIEYKREERSISQLATVDDTIKLEVAL